MAIGFRCWGQRYYSVFSIVARIRDVSGGVIFPLSNRHDKTVVFAAGRGSGRIR
ncbi:hypothetical protein DDI_3156 [Dickeya dianthicola RNS04.9]|nr:hypothetical protein DDI_3156 [Dickeya dianthicola RNS04.9]